MHHQPSFFSMTSSRRVIFTTQTDDLANNLRLSIKKNYTTLPATANNQHNFISNKKTTTMCKESSHSPHTHTATQRRQHQRNAVYTHAKNVVSCSSASSSRRREWRAGDTLRKITTFHTATHTQTSMRACGRLC